MLKIIKYIKYGVYMIFFQLKGIKYALLKKFKGMETASEYVKKAAFLWSKFTIKTIGIDIDLSGEENIPNEPCIFIGNLRSMLHLIACYMRLVCIFFFLFDDLCFSACQ